jgi:hypothetical protein
MLRKSPDRSQVAASIRSISRQMIKSSGHSGLRGGVARVNKCLTALHTITKCRLKIRLTRSAQSLNVSRQAAKIQNIQYLTDQCPPDGLWHEACDIPSGLGRIGGSRNMGRSLPPEGAGTWNLAGFHDGICCREVPH